MGGVRLIPVAHDRPTASYSPGLSRVPVLPCEVAPTRHLGINVLRTRPGGRTSVHHHGTAETTGYVLEGTMRFYCGPGLEQHVDNRPGDAFFIEPHAVHVEHNPEPAVDNLAIVMRAVHGVALIPCEVPTETPGGRTGVARVSPPAAGGALAAPAASVRHPLIDAAGVGARQVAIDRLILPAGAEVAAPAPEPGETAVTVLRGRVAVGAPVEGDAVDAATGDWLYVEPGTRWHAHNPTTEPAELLVLRALAPPA